MFNGESMTDDQETPSTKTLVHIGLRGKILQALSDGGGLSSADLQEKLDCSAASVSAITRELVSEGLIVKTTPENPNRRKPPTRFSLSTRGLERLVEQIMETAPRPKFDPSQLKGRSCVRKRARRRRSPFEDPEAIDG